VWRCFSLHFSKKVKQKLTLLSNRFAYKGVRSVKGVLRTIINGISQAIPTQFHPINHAKRAIVVANALESKAIREPQRFFCFVFF